MIVISLVVFPNLVLFKLFLVIEWTLLLVNAMFMDEALEQQRSLTFFCHGRKRSKKNTDAFGTGNNNPINRCDQAVGTGRCIDTSGQLYDFCGIVLTEITRNDCLQSAERLQQVVGVTYDSATQKCYAYWENGSTRDQLIQACPNADSTFAARNGTGIPAGGDAIAGNTCYACRRL